MSNDEEQSHAQVATRDLAEQSEETPANPQPERRKGTMKAHHDQFETDLWETAGKKGIPELPAQPDPNPPAFDSRDPIPPADPAQALRPKPGRKPGRPRGSRTGARNENSNLDAIVYATRDRPESGGVIVDRVAGEIVVNNGSALITIPLREEGKTWQYLHIRQENARLGSTLLTLAPATIRILPRNEQQILKAETRDPAPCAAPVTNYDFRVWDLLREYLGDLQTAIEAKEVPPCHAALTGLVRGLSLLQKW